MSKKYEIFEVDNCRILAPNKDFISKMFGQVPITKKNLKKLETVDYIVTHTNNGNNFTIVNNPIRGNNIEDIYKYNDNKNEKDRLNLILTPNQISHLLNRDSFKQNPKVNKKICYVSIDPIPMNSFPIDSEMKTKDENAALKSYINYYLNDLGLKMIEKIGDDNYYELSTLGDAKLKYDLRVEYSIAPKDLTILESNEYMKMVLVNLGYFEFFTIPNHLSGTFFEALYFCAIAQNNDKVKNKLQKAILDPYSKHNKLSEKTIIWKE